MTALLRVKKIWLHFLTPEGRGWRVSPSRPPTHTHNTNFALVAYITMVKSESQSHPVPRLMSQHRNLHLHTIIWHKLLNPFNIWPKKKILRPFYISIRCFKFIGFSNTRKLGRSYTPPLCVINLKADLERLICNLRVQTCKLFSNSSLVLFFSK